MFVEKFASAIRSIGWNGIAFKYSGEDYLFDMNSLVEENVELLNREMAGALSLEQVVAIIKQSKGERSE
jgi:hypothetical protein